MHWNENLGDKFIHLMHISILETETITVKSKQVVKNLNPTHLSSKLAVTTLVHSAESYLVAC